MTIQQLKNKTLIGFKGCCELYIIDIQRVHQFFEPHSAFNLIVVH